MEACATSHCWGRVAQGFGHNVRLVPPIYVKPFVKRQKNNAADAAAIAEAALRPNMHCVAVKKAEHQARAVAFRTHQCFIRQRAQLINALRGHLAEFMLVVAQGPAHLKQVIGLTETGTAEVPDTVKEIVRRYLDQIDHLTAKTQELTRRQQDTSRESVEMRRLCSAPGVGPVSAGAIMAFAPDLRAFSSGRNFAAWLGLVPRQRSTGSKTRRGGVSKMGQTDIRKLLIVGAMSRLVSNCWGPTLSPLGRFDQKFNLRQVRMNHADQLFGGLGAIGLLLLRINDMLADMVLDHRADEPVQRTAARRCLLQ